MFDMPQKKKVLMVVANDGFQDHEFGVSFSVFHSAWLDITIVAGRKWECRGVFGAKTFADIDLFFADATKYDMVVFIWGWGAYAQYFHDQNYLRLAKNAKKIGAICIAPMIVSESGIFNWKTVTGRDQDGVQKKFIEKNGGFWTPWPVVVCWNIVTWDGPDAAEEFAKKCVELLCNG